MMTNDHTCFLHFTALAFFDKFGFKTGGSAIVDISMKLARMVRLNGFGQLGTEDIQTHAVRYYWHCGVRCANFIGDN